MMSSTTLSSAAKPLDPLKTDYPTRHPVNRSGTGRRPIHSRYKPTILVGFEKACRLLERFPSMGVKVYAEHPLLAGMRRTSIEHFPKYLLFYRAVESDIVIERVIHGARDLPLLLNAKQPN